MNEEQPEGNAVKKGWVIDKRIPIATLVLFTVSVLFNTTVAGWYASKMDSRVSSLENDAVLNRLSRDKVVNLEAEMAAINTYLKDIKENDLRDIKDTLTHMMWDRPRAREEAK
jgi:hypothetical protein